jgi:hypothetical protein
MELMIRMVRDFTVVAVICEQLHILAKLETEHRLETEHCAQLQALYNKCWNFSFNIPSIYARE